MRGKDPVDKLVFQMVCRALMLGFGKRGEVLFLVSGSGRKQLSKPVGGKTSSKISTLEFREPH